MAAMNGATQESESQHFSPYRSDGKLVCTGIRTVETKALTDEVDSMASSAS